MKRNSFRNLEAYKEGSIWALEEVPERRAICTL